MTLEELEIVVKANVEQATKQLKDLKAQMQDIENDKGMQENLDKISKASQGAGDSVKKSSKDFSLLESVGSGALESLLKKMKFTKAECGELATSLSEIGTALGSVLAVLGAVAIGVVLAVIRVKMLIAEYKLIWKILVAFLTPAIKIFVGMLKQVAKVIKDQVSQAISTLKQKMSDGINNLVQVNSQLNDSMSELKSSLTQTGNALATAVAPIIQAIIPLMTQLLAVITNVANGIAQVTASLFGSATTFKKAIKVNEDYAKSVQKINGALAKFDELNIINDNGTASPYDMFRDEAIDPEILELTNGLKELWNLDNIEGLKDFGTKLGEKVKEQIVGLPAEEWGNELGTNVNKALTLANGFLEEEPFKDLGGKIADLLLGFIDDEEGLSPETVGEFIGNLINNGFGMIKDFLDEMDAKDGWTQVGDWLARSLNTAIETMDADDIGEAINSAVNGILDLAITFFDTADWDMYFQKIKDILDKQHWTEIILKILYLFLKAWILTESIRRMVIESIVTDVYNSLHESSNPFAQLLLFRVFWIVDTIKDSIKSISTTAESIIEDIKKASRGWLDFFEGIFTGDWERAWEGLKTFTVGIAEALADALIGVINVLINMINNGMDRIESTVNSMIDTLNSIPGLELNIGRIDLSKYHIEQLETLAQRNLSANAQRNNIMANKNHNGKLHSAFTQAETIGAPTTLNSKLLGRTNDPELVSMMEVLHEASGQGSVSLLNAIEEMGDKFTTALDNVNVYAEFDYDKLKVGLDNENYRVGGKLYGV